MTISYDQIDAVVIDTEYREDVRRVIPEDIQDAIRERCGDKPGRRPLTVILPPSCDLGFSDAQFAAAAVALRAQPDLVGKLRWHRAAVAAFLGDYGTVDQQTRQLQRAIEKAAA